MDQLAIVLGLNAMLVLVVSLVAGLMLYLAIKNDRPQAAWHLLHAGGAGRAVLLLALAAMIEYPALTLFQLQAASWLLLVFVWTSMMAMGIRAVSGQRGLRLEGSLGNRLVYLLYAIGTLAVFPGCALLIYGFWAAL